MFLWGGECSLVLTMARDMLIHIFRASHIVQGVITMTLLMADKDDNWYSLSMINVILE